MSNSDKSLPAYAIEGGGKKLGEKAIDRALNAIIDFGKEKYGESQVKFGNVFDRYLKNAVERYNKVKTIATGLNPRPVFGIDSIYVNVGVKYKDTEIDTKTVDSMLKISNNILIMGTGGIGKSMLMRYLFLNTVYSGDYVPVLLELRRMDKQKSGELSILELIYTCMEDFDTQLPKEQFEFSLRTGKYLFLFDGFDEVKENIAFETADAIQKFSSRFPENKYIITSRPRERFCTPLETFTVLESLPLNKKQACELASKIWPNDEKTKDFCGQLDSWLFYKYKDFAENPLLLTMMALTFMRNNSIPDHLADFYQKAYDALYSVHDNNNKGIFQREFKCKRLSENEFKAIFSHFCFQSFFREVYEFDDQEIITSLETSIQKLGLHVSAENYLADLRDVVCMMKKDGLKYVFAHRSFQTYFAACYTADLGDEAQKKLFKTITTIDRYVMIQDYFELVSQIVPGRFGTNAIEDSLRNLKKQLEVSDDPEITLLKIENCGFEIYPLIKPHRNSLGYGILFVSDSDISVIINMFRRFVYKLAPLYYGYNGHDGNEVRVIEILTEYGMRKEGIFYFDEIDSVFCDTERYEELYAALNSINHSDEVIAAIYEWLEQRDIKKETLKTSNFIFEL